MIENNIVRVDRKIAMKHLKPKLDGYRSNWPRVYIGVTTEPRSRWNQHAPNGWAKMVLIYEALTPQIAQALERDLIDYARRCNFVLPVENINSGGEGISSVPRRHYLYVLCG